MGYIDNKVKVTVIESKCPKYKVGDVICFEGSMLDKENSDNVCMVAMNALYPFIYSFRKPFISSNFKAALLSINIWKIKIIFFLLENNR